MAPPLVHRAPAILDDTIMPQPCALRNPPDRHKKAASRRHAPAVLPTLTANKHFLEELISEEAPCIGLGLVQEGGKKCGFFALRSDRDMPSDVTDGGFSFGHGLLGTSEYEVIQFTFEFYGYKTYNAIINPNNEIVRTVLGTMIKSGDYFFFAVNPNGSVTTFRSELEEENLVGLKSNFYRINYSSTTDAQYRRALISFKKKPYPEGTLLNWVCRDDIEYLDLSKNRYELSPAAVGSV